MKLYKIEVTNFRLLKNFSMDMEDILTLVIGKNNSGKTSVAQVLNKFLKTKNDPIDYNDFNLDFRDELEQLIQGEVKTEKVFNEKTNGIKLRLFIRYEDADDLSVASYLIKDLSPECDIIVLGFDYVLFYDDYKKLHSAYQKYIENEISLDEDKNIDKIRNEDSKWLDKKIHNYMERYHRSFFQFRRKTIAFDMDNQSPNENDYTLLSDIPQFKLHEFIKYDYIEAKRQVDNKNSDKTLSSLTADLYNVRTSNTFDDTMESFQTQLVKMDEDLSRVYTDLFKDMVGVVSDFGGLYPNETNIEVLSKLQHKDLLNSNTKVVYSTNDKTLPESYNGLGYMNLIAMLFQIEIIKQRFIGEKGERMADINILLIEEPEAHTHPQMQYVFIKNIKNLLNKGISNGSATRIYQTIISTHSANIVTESNFDDIKYLLRKNNDYNVQVKNLKDLRELYDNSNENYFAFLKQYLTINNSELFFADKAIFIEGDTERILMPAFIKKIDEECNDDEQSLLSQNISIIETGNYSQIFAKFVNFIGLKKVVVFTDLDIVSSETKKKEKYIQKDKQITSNSSLIYYYGEDMTINDYVDLNKDDKLFCWNSKTNKWEKSKGSNCNMMVCYETKSENYQPRSFEDCFINENKDFIKTYDFKNGLKTTYLEKIRQDPIDVYDLAENGIKKKSSFAIEILLNGTLAKSQNTIGWEIPGYIKEGLQWLKK